MFHKLIVMLSGRTVGGEAPDDGGQETSAFSYPTDSE